MNEPQHHQKNKDHHKQTDMNQEDTNFIDRREFLSKSAAKALPFLGLAGFGAWMAGCIPRPGGDPGRSDKITTAAATNITHSGATLGGTIVDEAEQSYSERGICYNTERYPSTNNTKITVAGAGTGSFNTTVTGLTEKTTYYVRAYMIIDQDTVYGNEVNFTTAAAPVNTLALTTSAASAISATGATLGGNITNAGTPAYTERGVAYASTQNPTTNNTKRIITGSGTGAFSAAVTGLTANTQYYARAYAINTISTVYGNQVNFSTPAAPACSSCTKACMQTCSNQCSNRCASGCSAGCSSACTGSCNGCTGTNYSTCSACSNTCRGCFGGCSAACYQSCFHACVNLSS